MTAIPSSSAVSLADFYAAMPRLSDGSPRLSEAQKKAVEHDLQVPLWVIAGPGTGKTYTLVWQVLKRLLVDDIPPQRMVVTTFTRKAATELRTRLIQGRDQLVKAGLSAASALDLSQLLLGTLHELCSDVLRKQRYPETLRVRILGNQLSQQFFVQRTRNPLMECDHLDFWRKFKMQERKKGQELPPYRTKRAKQICTLLNRLTENNISPTMLLTEGDPQLNLLADSYGHYVLHLRDQNRSDQALMQQHFLAFLNTPTGQQWVDSGLTVIVDEYQDTNPIQEEIYFKLAGGQGDLAVVGDDDQSLYRFRGATVESLTRFDVACQHYLGRTPTPLYLQENRRSHPRIVEWVNQFIGNHPEMTDPNPNIRVRAPHKPPLEAKADLSGPYPAVAAILENDEELAARQVVELVTGLLQRGMVSDPSQIALLALSTQEADFAVKPYVDALRAAELTVYNPRSKQAQFDQALLALIGAFMAILDPNFRRDELTDISNEAREYLSDARRAFGNLFQNGGYPDLRAYVQASRQVIAQTDLSQAPSSSTSIFLRRGDGDKGEYVTFGHLFYKLLAHEPFQTDLQQADSGGRLKVLSQVLAEYESLYQDGHLVLEADPGGQTRVANKTLEHFYGVFVEGIQAGLDDPEDDEVSVQAGAVNVMTIHQSKGLEFEVVVVLRPYSQPSASSTHAMEDELDALALRPTRPPYHRSREQRAAEDAIRLAFVAYSRAKRLLVLAGALDQRTAPAWNRALGLQRGGNEQLTRTTIAARHLEQL